MYHGDMGIRPPVCFHSCLAAERTAKKVLIYIQILPYRVYQWRTGYYGLWLHSGLLRVSGDMCLSC